FAAELHHLRQEAQAVQEQAEAVIRLAAEQVFPFWLAQGTSLRGWALVKQGQRREEGITQIRQGLAVYQDTGAELGRPYYLAELAEACGLIGQAEEGLRMLAEALARVHSSGERYYEAKLYQLKGELTLQSKQVEDKSKTSHRRAENNSEVTNPQPPVPSPQAEAEAEGYFQKAIAAARCQD